MSKKKNPILLNLDAELKEKLKIDSKANFMTMTQYIKYLILRANKKDR